MSEYDVAIHEAGHVVAAAAGGLSIRYATIVPDHDSLGHIVSRAPDDGVLWNSVVMKVSGCASASRGPSHRRRLAHALCLLEQEGAGDLRWARRYAAQWLRIQELPEDAIDRVVVAATSLSVGMMARPAWSAATKRVALALMTRGTISGRTCLRLAGVAPRRSAEGVASDAVESFLGVR